MKATTYVKNPHRAKQIPARLQVGPTGLYVVLEDGRKSFVKTGDRELLRTSYGNLPANDVLSAVEDEGVDLKAFMRVMKRLTNPT